jgi:magnesium transporter
MVSLLIVMPPRCARLERHDTVRAGLRSGCRRVADPTTRALAHSASWEPPPLASTLWERYDRAMPGDSLADPAAGAIKGDGSGGVEASGDRTGPSVCYVVQHDGSEQVRFDRATVEGLLAGRSFFWLDLAQPDGADFEILRDVFRFHPLAVEDSEHFDQRAKLDDYDDFIFIVVYGATPDGDQLVEVHCFYSERFLVTVHRDDCPAFADIRRRYQDRDKTIEQPSLLLYRVVDGLVDSFFPVLAAFDNRIDELEDQIFLRADDRQLQEIFGMKRLLVGMRKAVTPQRDTFASLMGRVAALPGLADEDERYFRDVYDHLIRISDLIDSYRDLLTGAMDVYLSTVSNRLNSVMKQLTVIATIFLPLTFITGFFGQNFGWMVNHIGGFPAFLVFGIGGDIVILAALLMLFKRRGWF